MRWDNLEKKEKEKIKEIAAKYNQLGVYIKRAERSRGNIEKKLKKLREENIKKDKVEQSYVNGKVVA